MKKLVVALLVVALLLPVAAPESSSAASAPPRAASALVGGANPAMCALTGAVLGLAIVSMNPWAIMAGIGSAYGHGCF